MSSKPRHSAVFALLLATLAAGCGQPQLPAAGAGKRIIVLGIDGMDPQFLERHWKALPNLDRLRQEGDFRRLRTTSPPQSPVAWSTFITGMDPGGHGIYDFIHRDPETMAAVSSMTRSIPGGRQLRFGPYLLPLSGGRVETLRRGTPFWKILADHGVPATVLRMPTDFPPVECEAHSLAGMGAPDLRGTFGTFAFFTDDEVWKDRKPAGGEVFMVGLENHQAVLRLPGPANALHRDQPVTHAEIRVSVDPAEPVARFEVGDRRLVLKQGEWSEWVPVRFELVPHLASAEGMVRIYAKQLRPHLAVYVSPVNIDPADPAMPISAPDSYSAELAGDIGPFYTQGMPYDTAALRHGIFTRQEYLAHSREVSEQTLRILQRELPRFQNGLLFFHFFGIDQDSHMLWGRYDDELLDTYRLVDEAVGRVRQAARDATLIVMSDHGFAAFDRAVHLNTWLLREGFLALTGAAGGAGEEPFANVDWSRTKAYAMGLNGVYVNQQFREREGSVAEGEEARQVAEKIRERLLEFRDPASGRQVVTSVAAAPETDAEAAFDRAPDLIVGYAPGYRASWQTALGSIPEVLIEDNRDEWRGDHCIDARFVPGILLSNRPSRISDPSLRDLTVTVLAGLGVEKTPEMQGRDIHSPAR
jgi:predicted AlkP superfamily phosphohydrolase/phosphomutase